MPLYDYKCLSCGNVFETLVLPQFKSPGCPKCGKKKLEQLISTFDINSAKVRRNREAREQPRIAKLRRDAKLGQASDIKKRGEHH
jgi:putative FmdB family regulatory protein